MPQNAIKSALAELIAQRERIDRAIAALEEASGVLGGREPRARGRRRLSRGPSRRIRRPRKTGRPAHKVRMEISAAALREMMRAGKTTNDMAGELGVSAATIHNKKAAFGLTKTAKKTVRKKKKSLRSRTAKRKKAKKA